MRFLTPVNETLETTESNSTIEYFEQGVDNTPSNVSTGILISVLCLYFIYDFFYFQFQDQFDEINFENLLKKIKLFRTFNIREFAIMHWFFTFLQYLFLQLVNIFYDKDFRHSKFLLSFFFNI